MGSTSTCGATRTRRHRSGLYLIAASRQSASGRLGSARSMAGNGFKYQGTRPWRNAKASPQRTTRRGSERNALRGRLAGMSGLALCIERTYDDGAARAKEPTLGPRDFGCWGLGTLALGRVRTLAELSAAGLQQPSEIASKAVLFPIAVARGIGALSATDLLGRFWPSRAVRIGEPPTRLGLCQRTLRLRCQLLVGIGFFALFGCGHGQPVSAYGILAVGRQRYHIIVAKRTRR